MGCAVHLWTGFVSVICYGTFLPTLPGFTPHHKVMTHAGVSGEAFQGVKGTDCYTNDSDNLMFIQAERSQQSMSNGNSVDVKLFIAKNRHGESGFVPFRWQPQYHRYVAISDRGESQ